MDDPASTWPAWKFNMKREDLPTNLHDQYNTYLAPIQSPEAFYHDISDIAHTAHSLAEFHNLAHDRRQQRLDELNEALESASYEIIGNPNLIETPQWEHAVQLFRSNSLDSLVQYFASYLPQDHRWHPRCKGSVLSDTEGSVAARLSVAGSNPIAANETSQLNAQTLPSTSTIFHSRPISRSRRLKIIEPSQLSQDTMLGQSMESTMEYAQPQEHTSDVSSEESQAWLALEALFYLIIYLPLNKHLQKPANHPPPPCRADRRKLFLQCHENIPDLALYLKKWFRGAPEDEIKRDNVKDFFRWAFLNMEEHDSAYDEELEEYIGEFEELLGRRFESGRGNAKCLRMTLDKVEMLHRSLTWYLLLRDPKISVYIGPVVFVDAVSFLLHLPDVAYNFICRRPSQTNEYLLSYFGSKDIGIAHTLFRRFFWADNLLWKEDLQNRPTAVVLAGRDSVIDTKSIRAYLLGSHDWVRKAPEVTGKNLSNGNVDVIWFQNLDHGQVFDQKTTRLRLVETVQAFCNRVDRGYHKAMVDEIKKN
ncbi:hypothetical protein IL306_005748 [Fusarium sp. DS 682]|nr:hypothetical protein IL306_005748 [Fusarium sp. DS 682]